ncbi:MAG: DUF805 domain-containing protein [Reyranella sp.]|nr:DUF805 domain-containing protein [Reyranella sp.]
MQALLFSFQGRINRAKFWLIHIGIDVAFVVITGLTVGGAALSGDVEAARAAMGTSGAVATLLFIPLVWIGLAASVKRWHDRGKSGWWVLIGLVPVIGGLWFLIECGFLAGTSGPNAYGSDPLTAI